ncbi:CG43867 [Drosophila busckii]|uniref:CG43867 n=2 Tax=Drosophila busckii TaxID=30019 RepID=A0A0M3QYV8_DROBS|nr:CG43867 [Drosophila busckii]
MEQRLSEWPRPQTQQAQQPAQHIQQSSGSASVSSSVSISGSNQQQEQSAAAAAATAAAIASVLTGSSGVCNDASAAAISSLEIQVEEQRQLRLHDARQIEAKAAKIKEWVNNKLRDLEEQNQLLREQNIKCNQQLELLKNHIANQSQRHSIVGPVRNSLSLDVQDFSHGTPETRRRSESLDPQEIISRPLTSSYPHHQHRRNLSMEPQELERNLVAAVDGLALAPLSSISSKAASQVGGGGGASSSSNARPDSSDTDTAHDYAEIYTPSCEKLPAWMKNNPGGLTASSGGNSASTTTTTSELGVPRPPTPPLHRFPSWEAKIYQVANDGLVGTSSTAESAASNEATPDEHRSNTLSNGRSRHAHGHAHGHGHGHAAGQDGQTPGTPQPPTRQQQTASGGFCDISVPVYATVKGRASQIRSMPFTGDSSDDSSDGEDNAVMLTHNSHNSTASTDNTETSTSGSASSPSKSLKTSCSLSPAKRSGSESPKNAKTRGLSDDYALPPDAVSETTCMDASMPSLLMRQSYVDSPSKKLESLEKMGHLAKLGGKLKTWRKRWFVLKNGQLNYWKCQHDAAQRKPQGQILLDEACRINRAEGASTFEIDTGKKVYYLTADSHATMDDWIRVLQNVQRRNATKLLLSRDDQKPTVQGWVTKVKNGHAKKCWCVLLGKMFLYFKAPAETNPLGQINMRDARVEEVEHVSDSDSEEREEAGQDGQARLTVAIYPAHQGPTYLILAGKPERDNWLYHLTVVSGGGPSAGTQYEQLVQKLMETDGDPNCVLWRHPILLHTKDTISAPLSSLHTEAMQPEAIKLFKSIQLFMSVAVNQPGIDYHVVLAQNALQQCLDMPELQTEMICILIKQTSRHLGQKLSVGVQVNKKLGKQTRAPLTTPIIDCKSNPPAYSFVQGWQLLALAVSLFVPKSSRLLWYLKLHLSRNADTKTETGKYAAYCERALERTLKNGGRETKPSRMEVLSILLKNPYHHSLPHAIPVHMMNATYQVVSFDGSTTIEEFQSTLAQELGTRDASNGFCLFSDDPIEKDLEHYLEPLAKLCDVISKWETALREKGSGKFENSRVIQLSYKNRLYWKHTIKCETDKERLLLCYQTNAQIVQGRFPLSRELALELASLMSQIDLGDYTLEKSRDVGLKALDKFYPYRYRDALSSEQLKDVQELLVAKWTLLKGRSTLDCVRIYLTCCRKWPYFGACLFQAKPRHCEPQASSTPVAWLAVAEDALNVLELSTMAPIARYPYSTVMTFGGCQDDFMLVVAHDEHALLLSPVSEQKLLFAMSKPKILEITLLIADYMNALGHTVPGTPQMNSLTRNGSHRSLRTSARQTAGAATSGATGFSTNANTTAHNTLNSHATHTLQSNHSHTLSSSHHGAGVAAGGSHHSTLNSTHQQQQQHHAHPHQPDILKSTPDHQRIK